MRLLSFKVCNIARDGDAIGLLLLIIVLSELTPGRMQTAREGQGRERTLDSETNP